MITEIFGTTLPQTVDTAFAATCCCDDQRLQYGGTLYLGERFRLLRSAQHLLDLLSAGDGSLPVPAPRRSRWCQPVNHMVGIFLRRHYDYFHHVWRWFATIPAYLADIFGTRYVGGIHGRLLTLEHRWFAGTFSNHITTAKLGHQSDK